MRLLVSDQQKCSSKRACNSRCGRDPQQGAIFRHKGFGDRSQSIEVCSLDGGKFGWLRIDRMTISDGTEIHLWFQRHHLVLLQRGKEPETPNEPLSKCNGGATRSDSAGPKDHVGVLVPVLRESAAMV